MNDDREGVLAAVRRALGRETPPEPAAVETEHRRHLSGELPRPTWRTGRVERFLERFERAAGTCARLESSEDIPAAVADFLGPMDRIRLRLAGHPLLREQPWPEGWEVAEGPDGAGDWPAAIAVAYAGLAETGSIVMPAAPERPTSLNFLPDYHLVVLREADVVDYMEEAWERLLAEGSGLPRAVNVITGPSRTADVEQTIQLGAHGPRRLHLLLMR